MLRDFTKQELDSMPIFNTKKDIEDWFSIMHKKIEQEQHKVPYISSIYTEETHKQNKNFLESSSIYLKYASLESKNIEKDEPSPQYTPEEFRILAQANLEKKLKEREEQKDFIRSIPKGRHDQTLKNTHDAFQALNNARAEIEEIYPPNGISNYEWQVMKEEPMPPKHLNIELHKDA